MSTDTTTNGDVPQSQFLSHLISYPVISDGITTYKSHPYGAKSISLAHSAYSTAYTTIIPRISPLLETPYSYVAPYLAKADSIGDSTLSHLDSRFPIVRAETSTISEKVQGVAGYPFVVVGKGREFVSKTWSEEYERSGGSGVVKGARAVIGTELKVGAAVIEYLRTAVGKFREEGKKVVENEKAELNGAAN